MRATTAHHQQASPTRLLEMLADRFGAFEAIASSSIRLARLAPDEEVPMEPQVAEAVLEFGEDLREARQAAAEWCGTRAAR
ncbi:MAG TPA: hypothetical protein VFT45_19820 [Longimicrobium sp.]|nr:hypothetical protein [Longimicrobium sp.]